MKFSNRYLIYRRRNFSYMPPPSYESHPFLKRNSSFSQIKDHHIEYFRKVIGDKNVIQDSDILLNHNLDWTRKYLGQSKLLLCPDNTKQVSDLLSFCNKHKLALTPQAGNTGLVGGSVPVFDEIIVSTVNLNKSISFDPISNVLTCDSGFILQNIDEYLKTNYNHCMPLDLGAKGSCHIGGNIATNAAGLRYIKYGSLHGSTLGLEIVLADGTILSDISSMKKNNTGYDLKHLFIGSEGTLGIITKVAIYSPSKPKSNSLILLSVPNFEAAQKIMLETKRNISDILSAFEFWDIESLNMVMKHHENLRSDFSHLNESFFVLIETFHMDFDNERVAKLLEKLLEDPSICKDGILSSSESQFQKLWSVRELIPESLSKEAVVYKYDVSLPTEQIYQLVIETRNFLSSHDVTVLGYGHLGDGNLHLTILAKEVSHEFENLIDPFIFSFIQKYNGSISAEHGIGLMKANKLHYSKNNEMIQWMKNIKKLFDPNCILNPYKVLPYN